MEISVNNLQKMTVLTKLRNTIRWNTATDQTHTEKHKGKWAGKKIKIKQKF